MVNNNGSRRIRTSALTRGEIATAALRMFAQDGLAGLSMRRLGTELGVHYSTLYWHISDKRELLRLVLDAVLADVPMPRPGADPRAGLAELFSGLRVALRAHPGAAVLVLESGTPGPHGTEFARSARDLLTGVGLDEHRAGWAYRTLVQYTAAAVQQESAPSGVGRLAGADGQEAGMTGKAVPAPRTGPDDALGPHRVDIELGQPVALRGDERIGQRVDACTDERGQTDAQFGYGLDCLLHGIAARA